MDYLVFKDPIRIALYCHFRHKKQDYLADLCFLDRTTDPHTECAIFKTVDRQITLENADGVYFKEDIPLTEKALLECIEEFKSKN